MRCEQCNEELTDSNTFPGLNMCINCALEFRYCVECGSFVSRSHIRSDMCRPCWRENPTLAGSGTRIDTKPINLGDAPLSEGERTFGCELETEVSGRGDPVKKHIKEIDELMGDRVLMKRDGSLNNGMEIVTRPAPLKKQYALWNDFFSIKHNGMKSFNTKTCGLHIHVGRCGIPDMENTIAKVVCFINAEANSLFVYLIAGRTDSGYAKIKSGKTLENGSKCSGDRYEAVNLTNKNTIEFRIFRGTLKKESLFKDLVFTEAIIDYCSQAKTLEQSISRTGFVRFIKEKGKWPHLLAFIQARWYGVATKLSEKAGWRPHKNCKVPSERELALEE